MQDDAPKFLAAVIQLTARQDLAENLAKARALAAEAARRGATLVVLPENFTYLGVLAEKARIAETLSEDQPGPILAAMQAAARELHIYLLLGGIPTPTGVPGHCYNTSVLLSPQGRILAFYRKRHLFDIDIPGGVVFRESDVVSPGDAIVTSDVLGIRLGFSICYDVRFPELYRTLVQRGAQVIAVPAAFSQYTGKDHWLPLLRARAIENQVYLLAADQYGQHTETRTTYGKSCIVDPWGTIIAQVSDGEGVAVAEIDAAYLAKVRRELPCLAHRRLS